MNFTNKLDPESEAAFNQGIFIILEHMFPKAERTLRVQLAGSIVYRRHRLLWNRRHTQKLAKERPKKPAAESSKEKEQETKGQPSGFQPSLTRQALKSQASQLGDRAKGPASSTLPSQRMLTPHNFKLSGVGPVGMETDLKSERSSSRLPRARYPELSSMLKIGKAIQCEYCLNHVEIQPGTEMEQNQQFV
jgi:hypothetical protein